MLEAVKRHPGDPHRQVNYILKHAHIPAAFGTDRPVSEKTRSDYGKELHRAVDLCRTVRMPIKNVAEMRRKHVIAFCRHWESEGLAEKTINKYVSTLRRVFALMGKRGTIPEGEEWKQILRDHGILRGTQGSSLIAKEPKGWRDHGLNVDSIIEAVAAEDPLVGCQMLMQLHFGLRVNESCQIVPADSDKGDHISVWLGTKGGKPRTVKFSSVPEKQRVQRRVFDLALQIASQNRKRCLGDPSGSLRAMKNRMNYLARKHGVQREGLGVTMHGLRHQFACDLFYDLTGLPAPVLRQVDSAAYVAKAELVKAAVLEVARQMGHERAPIAYAYLGSPFSQDSNKLN